MKMIVVSLTIVLVLRNGFKNITKTNRYETFLVLEASPQLNLKPKVLLLKPLLSELGLAQVVKAPEFQQTEACVGTLKAYKVSAFSWNLVFDTQPLRYIW